MNTDSLNYIEIVGPPGIGKSTVMKDVAGLWDKNTRWSLDPMYKNAGPWSNLEELMPSDLFINDNLEFSSKLFKGISQSALECKDDIGAAHKFFQVQGVIKIFKILYTAQSLLRKSDVLILDEGFAQRCKFLLVDGLPEEDMATTLRRTQMPKAYIIFKADSETIMERLAGREKRTQLHKVLGPKQLKNEVQDNVDDWEVKEKVIGESGLPMLTLKATRSPASNAKKIAKFATKFAISN